MNYESEGDVIPMEFEVGEEVLIDPYSPNEEELSQDQIDSQDDENEYEDDQDEHSDQGDNLQPQQQSEENEDIQDDGDDEDEDEDEEEAADGDSSDPADDEQQAVSPIEVGNTSHQRLIRANIPIDHQRIASSKQTARSQVAVKSATPSRDRTLNNHLQVVPSVASICQPSSKFVILNDGKNNAPFSHCLCSSRPVISSSESPARSYCQAVDGFDGKLIGCVNQAKVTLLMRTSKRVPFRVFCEVHCTRLRRHHCCPGCGIFLTQGDFLQCRSTPKQVHLFHKSCQLVNTSSLDPGQQHCPHCGQVSPLNSVRIKMNGPAITESSCYYLWQTPLLKTSTARITSKPSSPRSVASSSVAEDEIGVSLAIANGEKALSLSGLPFGLEREQLKSILIALSNAEKRNQVIKCSSNKNLVNLVKSGDVEKMAVIIGQGFDVNTRFEDHENETLLHVASRVGNLILVHLLIQAGANVDVTNNQLSTPLMAAVECGKNSVISYLIKVGASAEIKGEYGMNALHIAAKNSNSHAVKALIKSPKVNINSQDNGGYTALSYLTEFAQLSLVQMLLDAGADPNIQDTEGNVCLHWAAFSGDVSMVEVFIDLTPNMDVPNENFDTPLHIAAKKDNRAVVQ